MEPYTKTEVSVFFNLFGELENRSRPHHIFGGMGDLLREVGCEVVGKEHNYALLCKVQSVARFVCAAMLSSICCYKYVVLSFSRSVLYNLCAWISPDDGNLHRTKECTFSISR